MSAWIRISKPSYVDQYLAGIEHELFPDFSVQVQYIRRNYENFMGFIDTGATYDPVQRRDPGPDNELDTADDGELITVYNKSGDTFYLMTNPDNATRTYNGFQINVRKRFSHNWQTNTSYTWSRTRGNVNNNFGANAPAAVRRAILGQSGVFANPNRAILNDGPAVFDYTHHFKAEGTYRIPVLGRLQHQRHLPLHHRRGMGPSGRHTRPGSGQRDRPDRAARDAPCRRAE